MVDLNKLINGLSKSGAVSGFAGGLAGTAVAGALSGKKGKKMAKSALKVGALAAVGGLAYTAYKRYREGDAANAGASAGTGAAGRPIGRHIPYTDSTVAPAANNRWDGIGVERFESVVADTGSNSAGGLLLVRAMIAAASADGHMDSQERERIFSEAQRLELNPQEKAALFDELREPLSIHQLVSRVPNPETAIEVYAASLVAIDETRPEARDYLRLLADALELPAALVASMHAQASTSRRVEAA